MELISRFSTWPKSQDKTLNIFRANRAFKVKEKAFFINFKGLLVAKNCFRFASAPWEYWNLSTYLLTLFNFKLHIVRSSHRSYSIKRVVLRNFAVFTGKHLCWNLFFNKVTSLQACNFIKKRPQRSLFPVNIM